MGPCAAAAAELVTQPPVTLLLSEWLLQVFDQVLILKRMTHVESRNPLLTGLQTYYTIPEKQNVHAVTKDRVTDNATKCGSSTLK